MLVTCVLEPAWEHRTAVCAPADIGCPDAWQASRAASGTGLPVALCLSIRCGCMAAMRAVDSLRRSVLGLDLLNATSGTFLEMARFDSFTVAGDPHGHSACLPGGTDALLG
jgi:hypothetical protein